MSPERAIEQWAEVRVRADGDGLGYAGSTPVAKAMSGYLTSGPPAGGRLPRHITMHGLAGYLRVERVLAAMGLHYRATLEAVHIRPVIEVGRNHQQIASHLGITPSALASRLRRIREALRDVQG